MTNYLLLKKIDDCINDASVKWKDQDHDFYLRLITNANLLEELYISIYGSHTDYETHFLSLIKNIIKGYKERSEVIKTQDQIKQCAEPWFLSNELCGMSLYVDRFCGKLKDLPDKFNYLKELGINLLHLMPLFKSPPDASDGGYAVSDFRKINPEFGSLEDFKEVRKKMTDHKMFMMIDIVINHTSDKHEWAEKASLGSKEYQDYYYMFDDRLEPDMYDATMPEIFPETAPGNFTFDKKSGKWVMSVFHHYQWDLNYRNPAVFSSMLDNIFFYANLGVDILRIDAPAFIWKHKGTTSQNLPEAHLLLRLIKLCVQIATPGMALLGEAIVAPEQIIKYFGTGYFKARECDFAYNATQMALQWDALATGVTKVLLAGQDILQQKPQNTSWITYTRCHDDIGLGYDDYMIYSAGYDPHRHRQFIKDYYTGNYSTSDAMGALFSFNPKTGDARISGTLASLCGLENAINSHNLLTVDISIKKILLMQAMSFFVGGIPMLFSGDEAGYINDYSYLTDKDKNYDNRWMHRPLIDWKRNENIHISGSIENKVYKGTQQLLSIRKKFDLFSDNNNIEWLSPHNIHVAGFIRYQSDKKICCLFNFSGSASYLTWFAFREKNISGTLQNLLTNQQITVGKDNEFLVIEPYGILVLSN